MKRGERLDGTVDLAWLNDILALKLHFTKYNLSTILTF